MKHLSWIPVLCIATLLFASCAAQVPVETEPAAPVTNPTVAATTQALPPETTAETIPVETTQPPIVVVLRDEDAQMLLKIGMAELGHTECETCIALVMCTVLNRVNADRFGSSIYSVLHAQDQFTPVMDGTYDKAEPNDACRAALDMVIRGWDESQGALYYEFCEGESWHSKNLQLLTEHCNTRFYK